MLIKRKKRVFSRRGAKYGWLFCLPWIIGALLFFVYPLIYSLRLSFGTITDIANQTVVWAGLDNFKLAFSKDVDFLGYFLVTFKDTMINMPLIVIFSLFIATLLNTNVKGKGAFRAIYFLPVMLGTGFVMQQLLGTEMNADIAKVARELLLPDEIVKFLDPKITEAILDFLGRITIILWHSGVQIVIFLAGLQSVPKSMYEAARVDAASEWECFWFVTLPMIAPMILLNSVYTVVASFADTSNNILQYINEQAFQWSNWEYSSAVSWLYFIFILLVLGLVFAVLTPAS
ncbi:MAG: sugar ABC transporter permease, partial [Oscillospiraceae bacterium]